MENLVLANKNNAPAPVTQDVAIVDVETAKAEWEAYQKLVRELLDDSDYQEYNQGGELKKFPKKSAWAKLGRAFNVNTEIVDKEFILTKTGETREAYYCIRATLPNGRTVESDGSCSRHEKGKGNATSHTIRSTAKTRATNRAISELIGAGEVSAEELDPSFHTMEFRVRKEKRVATNEPEFIDVKGEVVKDPEPEDEIEIQVVKDDPKLNTMDSAKDIAKSIVAELPDNNTNFLFARMHLKKLIDERVISPDECDDVLNELKQIFSDRGDLNLL